MERIEQMEWMGRMLQNCPKAPKESKKDQKLPKYVSSRNIALKVQRKIFSSCIKKQNR